MDSLVDTVIEDDRWEDVGLHAIAERATLATLGELGLPNKGFSVVVMACDDSRIAALNADFRGKPQATNVLSWPSEERASDTPGNVPELPKPGETDDPVELGDIALAYDTCAAEAVAQDKTMGDHVMHLTVHGLLHLFGFDHQNDADATLMETTESRILASLGVADPY